MDEPKCAAHMFTFDESKAVPMKTFFSWYKDQFPMLAVIVDGHYGETIFDCFENFQVIRIHCYSCQPRVVCTDSKAAHATDQNYYTVPANTEHAFNKITGHSSAAGPDQTMTEILKENKLPVMVKFSTNRQRAVKIGTGTQQTSNIGNLLVTEQYVENYLLVNCIDTTELKMNSTYCLLGLTDKITATPITGFQHKSKTVFQAFLKQLDQQVATSGQVYEKTRGNPAMEQYKCGDETNIYSPPSMSIRRAPVPTPDSRVLLEIPPENKMSYYGNSKNPSQSRAKEGIPYTVPTTYPTGCNGKGITTDNSRLIETRDAALDHTGLIYPLPIYYTTQFTGDESCDDYEEVIEPPVLPARLPKKPVSIPAADQIDRAQTTTKETKHTKKGLGFAGKFLKTITSDKTYKNIKPPTAPRKPDYQHVNVESRNSKKHKSPHENKAMPQAVVKPITKQKLTNSISRRQPMPLPVEDTEDGEDIYTVPDENPVTASDKKKEAPVRVPILPITPFSVDNVQITSGKETLRVKCKRRSQMQVSGQSAPDVTTLTIDQVVTALQTLKLGKYADAIREEQVDGEILAQLTVEDMISELNMKKLEAIRLSRWVMTGHIPM